MKKLTVLTLASCLLFVISCKKKGCTDPVATNYNEKAKVDDGTCEYAPYIGKNVNVVFNHQYDGAQVMGSSCCLDIIKYNNLAGNNHSISHLQYLVSDIRFYKADGDSITTESHNLIDFDNTNSFTYEITENLDEGDYTGIGFVLGLEENDNTSGMHNDLNSANWSWPESLGGGYHFMKFEGKFIDSNTDTSSFAYHYGTAREITITDTIFHPNHTFINISQAFTISDDATITLNFNFDELFKNPNTWDLNSYSSMLMMNYNAQTMMRENAQSVFSWNSIN
jgi:hypothetical protein